MNLSDRILIYINANTHRETLEELSTKQIAEKFKITTEEAFKQCGKLAKDKKITKLDPVNGQKFDCCGWIRNGDPEIVEEAVTIQGNYFTAMSRKVKREETGIINSFVLKKDDEVVGHMGFRADGLPVYMIELLLVGQRFIGLSIDENQVEFLGQVDGEE